MVSSTKVSNFGFPFFEPQPMDFAVPLVSSDLQIRWWRVFFSPADAALPWAAQHGGLFWRQGAAGGIVKKDIQFGEYVFCFLSCGC